MSASALQIDGKIIIRAIFLHYNGSSGSFKRIARIDPDGSLDPTLSSIPMAPERTAVS